MIEIGKYNNLEIVKDVDFGLYLDGGEDGEILLPRRYEPKDWKPGDILEVFIYRDSEDRLIATSEDPFATVGQFALLEAIEVNQVGAFLDWGLPKHLFVPYREQAERMRPGEYYLVYIKLDPYTNRLLGTSYIEDYLAKVVPDGEFKTGDEVNLIISEATPIGFKAIVNQRYYGLLYSNEVFRKLIRGQEIKAYIKQVRYDGKIDLSLKKPGYDPEDPLAGKILRMLEQNNGFLPLSDKSPPDVIYDRFGVSKKQFKKALGSLYKARQIIIGETGINLINKE